MLAVLPSSLEQTVVGTAMPHIIAGFLAICTPFSSSSLTLELDSFSGGRSHSV